jgi:UDP-glucose 4-epimerase
VTDRLERYRGKTILVTGGTGFIGSAVVAALDAAEARILVVRGRDSGSSEHVDGQARVEVLEGDVRSTSFWDAAVSEADCIFHLAAQTSSRHANRHPAEDLKANLGPVARFVDACQRLERRPDIVFAGTVTQVGFTTKYPLDETVRDSPITVYDINKLAAEQYLRYYAREVGGRSVTLRLPNVYGPGPVSRHGDRGILNLMIRKALAGESLIVYGSGKYMRDFVHVSDIANAFVTAGASWGTVSGHHYVLGSGDGHTVLEMVHLVRDLVAAATGTRVEIQHIELPAELPRIDYRSFVADSRRFQADTGWSPRLTLSDGIAQTIQHSIDEART